MRTLIAVAVVSAVTMSCVAPDDRHREAVRLTGGDPGEGRALIDRHGCGACHVIDGIPGARGNVGPSLNGIRERPFVAGVLTHDVENIVRFIRDPRGVDSATVMPALGLDDESARHVVSFLYTLEP